MKKELTNQLVELKKQRDDFELDPSEYEDQYDDMLDDCYPELFGLMPSRILRECDPIGYRCGFADYIDSLEVSDDPKFQEILEEIEDLESEIEEMESE